MAATTATTEYDELNAYSLIFYDSYLYPGNYGNKSVCYYSVRLVRE